MDEHVDPPFMLSFLGTGDGLARRIREHDWSGSLGAPATWPVALKTLVGVMLGSNQPMFVVWGPEQRLLYNDSYVDILQGKDPDALGGAFLQVWREVAEELRPIVEGAYAGEPSNADDIMLMVERGGASEEMHFSYSYTPVRLEDDRVGGFFCVCSDITATVMAERAVRESEVRNRQIFDSASDYAIIATGLDGRITRWNEGAHRVLGWTEAEMLGEPADRFFTPEDRANGRIAAEMRQALESGRGNDERWHLREDGERFFAQGAMTPLRDSAGEAVGFVKVLRDWTAEWEADMALSRSRTELDAALVRLREMNETLEAQVADRTAERDQVWRNTRDLLGVADLEGRWVSVNPAWTRVLGWDAQKVVGRTSEWLEHPDDAAKTRAEVAHLADGHETTAFENRFRTRDGAYRWLSWTAAPRGGQIYCVGRDVTAEKARQEELAAAQDQLRQAQKVEAVGQLTGGVAHDFNNLLTVIRGSVELLRRPGLSEERRARYLAAIGDTADRAARLTSQLLAFARRQALTPETFDAAESVRALQEMVGTLSGSRIRLKVEAPEGPSPIHADRSQFDTAIINMAVNARDAMRGEGELTLRIRQVDGLPALRAHPAVPGDFVAVSLTDTGEGIPAGRIDQIFEPFFTTKAVGKGTGLGLSQVFGFAKQSGGEVAVDSEEGQGATFTLYLPRAAGEVHAPPGAAVAEEARSGGGACVLVVEDNPQVGEFAESALGELGYRTLLAPDAAHALAELEKAPDAFDVVFSDVVMPGMSGVELGRAIRQRHPHLPVVLTSGYSTVLAEEGADGFELVRKPYSIEQLARTLRKVVGERHERAAPGAVA